MFLRNALLFEDAGKTSRKVIHKCNTCTIKNTSRRRERSRREKKDFNGDLVGGLNVDVVIQAYVWLEV